MLVSRCRSTAPRVLSDAQRSLQNFDLLHVFVLKSKSIKGDMQWNVATDFVRKSISIWRLMQ
ncbi:hypothetical protein N184_10740 [Sinorhizobium sp. GL28]|nr:hypothetical protein N184_10740 [Sinorhizobium sp. GL28]